MVGVPVAVTIALHVGCGLVAVAGGAGAMLIRKGGRWHRRCGRIHLVALVGVGGTAAVLVAVDWAHRWHLAALGGLALGACAVGYAAIRGRPPRPAVHIAGMGTGYVVMLTAFYVDNGPRLPLWNLLPPIAFWLLPAVVGAPLTVRALIRYRGASLRGRPELREPA